jgi:hypothetical protein
MTESDERTLGRLEAHVADLRHDVKNLEQQVTALVAVMERVKGARIMASAIASAFGGAGGLLTAWLAGVAQRGGH